MGNRINIALRSAFGMLDDTWRASGVTVRTNEHGYESCSIHVPCALREATDLFTRPGSLRHEVCSGGLHLFDGRLEDIHLTGDGVDLQSFGDWNYMLDNTYSALWSTTDLQRWYNPAPAQSANSVPALYTFGTPTNFYTQNGLYIAPSNGETFGGPSNSPLGVWQYTISSGSIKNIVGIQFDFNLTVGTSTAVNWTAFCQTLDTIGAVVSTVWSVNQASSGAITGSFCGSFAATTQLRLGLFDPNAAAVVHGGPTGSTYVAFTNVRLVTTTTNMVNTTITLTTGLSNATVGSTANMYVGQHLSLSDGTNSAWENIVAIVDSTHITTTNNGHPTLSGGTCKSPVVYADEIVKDLLNGTQGILAWNPGCVASATGLIQSPQFDVTDELYDDQAHGDILDQLCQLGDNQTPPRQWEAGFYEGRTLFFRPQLSTATRAWYVDETEIDVDRSLTALYNNVYASYQDASGRTVRGGYAQDNNSISRYGIERTKVIQPKSTNSTTVAVETAAALQDTKDVTPRSKIVTKRVYDAAGGLWPLWCVRAGDTVTIRQYPAKLGTDVDEVRTFRIARTEYDVDNDNLTLEPGTAPASLDVLLAREVVNTTLKK